MLKTSGTPVTSHTVAHQWSRFGSYAVNLTVTDATGRKAIQGHDDLQSSVSQTGPRRRRRDPTGFFGTVVLSPIGRCEFVAESPTERTWRTEVAGLVLVPDRTVRHIRSRPPTTRTQKPHMIANLRRAAAIAAVAGQVNQVRRATSDRMPPSRT